MRSNKSKANPTTDDDLRVEYSREDFGDMVRGKYAKRCKDASNVVVLDPEVQKAFPNTQAVKRCAARVVGIGPFDRSCRPHDTYFPQAGGRVTGP